MYKRILVPLDGSKLAEDILPLAISLARGLNARVRLLSIVEEKTAASRGTALYGQRDDQLAASALRAAEDYLQGIAGRLQLGAGRVEVVARRGSAPHEIVDEAEREPGTLLALSSRGRSGVEDWLLGSVADKVLHATRAPLLLYRPQEEGGGAATGLFSSVVVPLDGSAAAESVLPHVVSLAGAAPLKVVLANVTLTMSELYGSYPGEALEGVPKAVVASLEQEAQEYLSAKANAIRSQGVKDVETRHLFGAAAVQILELVRDTPQCCVAITAYGHSGAQRWTLGSVAHRIVSFADAPVLIVRP